MSLLDHLDELRSRLIRSLLVYLVAVGVCWAFSAHILEFLLQPIRDHLFEGSDIVFINMTEPFLIYVKASAIAALFLVAPFLLYQLWAFVSPGLYRREKRLVFPFMFFGTVFFLTGGAFG
jgi:sec-independent protein translocase protein TatC